MMSDLCEENAMYEVKSDPLEESFAGAEEIAELRAGMADLKARLDGAAVIAARPALAGGSAQPEVKQFVEHYLRHGSTMGVEVKGHSVTLRDPPAFAPEPGVLAELLEGCDRLFATCRNCFDNAENFRGEPYLPGNDLLSRYGTG